MTLLQTLRRSITIAKQARREGRKPTFTRTGDSTVTELETPKTSARRIYVVTNSENGEESLIRATSPAAARNYAARIYSAELASQEDLVRLCAAHSVLDAE